VVLRVPLPLWAFAVLSIAPVLPVLVANKTGVVVFLTTTAGSRIASRSDDRWFVGTVTAVVLVAPFLPGLLGLGWDYGAGYFAFGNAFGVMVGVLLRRTERLAEDLRAADARLADVAVREERNRIARDVHDLVAHSLTVVVLHVGGARRLLRTDPQAAEAALADAERVCRESLDGIRGVVGLLREGDDQPGISLDLEGLASSYRSAGRPVALRVTGDPSALPLAIRVVLYRVVQESLANAARYGGGPIQVDVAAGEAAAEARIVNPLAATPGARGSGGFGLVGLREQVETLGGRLSGGAEGGEWIVTCRLPVRAAALPASAVGESA
jgi:signal transduction histidine kinase